MLPLIPIALTLLPELAKWMFGSKGEETAKVVAGVVATVTGTDDPAAAAAVLADPAKAASLRVQLAQIVAQAEAAAEAAKLETFKAALADTANARAQTVSLASSGSRIAWGAPIISLVLVVGFFLAFTLLLLGKPQSDPGTAAMLNILVGSLAAGFASTVGYWLGSSAGSARKDDLLAATVPAAQPSAAAEVSSTTADDLNGKQLAALRG